MQIPAAWCSWGANIGITTGAISLSSNFGGRTVPYVI